MRHFLASIVLLILPAASFAQNLPQPLTPFVSDFANVIDEETEARISNDLREFREQSGVEFAVVTINSTKDYGDPVEIEPFATGLFNTWGIGDATRNDGILMLVAVEDRAMRLELGSGYPPEEDDRAKRVIDHQIIPFFREARYGEGIEAGVLETIKRIQSGGFEPPSLIARISEFIPFILFGAFALILVFRNKIASGVTRIRRCPNCGQRMLSRQSDTVTAATRDVEGQRMILTRCSNCDYRNERLRVIPRQRSSGSSGFGGGSSSGGGASGRW